MRAKPLGVLTLLAMLPFMAAARLSAQSTLPPRVASQDTVALSAYVLDEEGRPLPGAEVFVAGLERRVRTDSKGRFRITGVAPGSYTITVRRIGYAAREQSLRTLALSAELPEVMLMPTMSTLSPIVAVAERGGLYGIVADTGMRPVAGARVTIAGSSLGATTDSLGAFAVPLRPGSYLVYVERKPFSRQKVGVTVPPTSGREIAIWMHTMPRAYDAVEGAQLFDLNQRIIGSSSASTKFFSRDALLELGITSLDGLARRWAGGGVSALCNASLAGQPNWSRPVNQLLTADVEFVEMYMSNSAGAQKPRGRTSINGNATTITTETGRGQPATSADCGNLSFVVWPRG
jgi:hypothetical protein